LKYLKSRGLAPFGYYRIVFGILILTVLKDTFSAGG
jgi:undecaprenyl pyrophosphate phosphatase UppP